MTTSTKRYGDSLPALRALDVEEIFNSGKIQRTQPMLRTTYQHGLPDPQSYGNNHRIAFNGVRLHLL